MSKTLRELFLEQLPKDVKPPKVFRITKPHKLGIRMGWGNVSASFNIINEYVSITQPQSEEDLNQRLVNALVSRWCKEYRSQQEKNAMLERKKAELIEKAAVNKKARSVKVQQILGSSVLPGTIKLGPINLQVEHFDGEKVSLYCQQDITLNELSEILMWPLTRTAGEKEP